MNFDPDVKGTVLKLWEITGAPAHTSELDLFQGDILIFDGTATSHTITRLRPKLAGGSPATSRRLNWATGCRVSSAAGQPLEITGAHWNGRVSNMRITFGQISGNPPSHTGNYDLASLPGPVTDATSILSSTWMAEEGP